ncbi:MAG: acyl-CoA thioesterase [Candidatus Eisenbacteria bacterium]|nr:thioesterase family protein [Candidatus Eisenbacteria bacterium]
MEDPRNAIRVPIRVRYADVDAMGVAYNAAYLVWFEVGRTEWLRAVGLTYREVEERGIALPVVEARLRFRRGARYDDLLDIESWVDEDHPRRIVFGYRILRGGECLADGTTSHLPVERSSGRAVRSPEWLRAVLAGGRVPGMGETGATGETDETRDPARYGGHSGFGDGPGARCSAAGLEIPRPPEAGMRPQEEDP